ncbi:MAG: heavy-metal-associated domain-containing protein, partial [Clostridiales bacterium]|nr:heavy-metal-associated domain-containing protein [Clostridiales bacterium]
MSNQKKTVRIEGMTCAACSSAIERAVDKIDGVDQVSVNLATEKMDVSFDQEKVSQDVIFTAIKKSGYKAIMDESIKTITLNVSGMTCAACVAAVERSLKKLDFVRSTSVNLATEKATVTYDVELGNITQIE